MPNIYLRMPLYLAEFYRGRNPNVVIAKDKPIVFPPFTEESNIIKNGCSVIDIFTQRNIHCYSSEQWRKFMNGYTVNGKKIYNQFVNTFPSFEELSIMEGCHIPKRSERIDYLCISLPRKVWIGEKEVNVNIGFSLLPDFSSELLRKMREDFVRTFVVFVCGYFWSCYANGIRRISKISAINRFCVNYNISCDNVDVENLRKLLMRYMKRWPKLEYMQIDAEAQEFAAQIETDSEDKMFDVMDFIKNHVLK